MEKIKPKPPELIRVKPPSIDLPQKDYSEFIMSFKFSNWKNQTVLRSRTIVTVLVTILSFVLVNFFGLDVDLGTVVESANGLQLDEAITVAGLALAAFFRKNAKVDLSKPSDG